ncbi:hypothetical protein DY000_02057179 [Brassica cretica]|uniref:Secreted protein n=1 Tax=Brassica cretica TaxID=69181 RepID=A0ABQ7A6Z2_BRACR|nr:hypothetical protein DY000_02057179 [Brassica cretica]
MRGFSGRVLLLRLGSVLFSRCGCGGFPASSVSLSLLGLVDPALMTWICCRFQLVALEVLLLSVGASVAWVKTSFLLREVLSLCRPVLESRSRVLSLTTSDLRWCWFGSGFFGAGSVVWCFSTSSFSPNKSFVLVRILSAALRGSDLTLDALLQPWEMILEVSLSRGCWSEAASMTARRSSYAAGCSFVF